MWRRFETFLAQSLQRRLIAVSALLLFLASLAFLLILLTLHTRMMVEENRRASLALNESLQIALENAMLKRDLDGLSEIVDNLGQQDGIGAIMIVTPQGEIRFSDRHDRIGKTLADPAIARAIETGEASGTFRDLSGEGNMLRSINPVHNRAICSQCHGDPATHPVNGLLIVDFRATPIIVHALRGTAVLIGMGAVVMALLAVGLWIATRRLILDRLEPLTEAVHAVGDGAVTTRVKIVGQDEIAGFATGFNDMAEHLERAQEALRTAHNALTAILAAIPDGVRVIGPDFRVLHANPAHLNQLGLPQSAVIGKPCHQLTHNSEVPCPPTLQICPVVRIIRGGEPALRFTDRHRKADGSVMNVEVMAAPIRMLVDGLTVDCVIEVIRDLDRDVSISHQQRLSEIALLANGVAHEINTPLSSILLALDTIRDAVPPNGEAREFTDLIETEIRTCMEVTESLMRLSVPSSAVAEAVDLVAVAHGILRLVRPNLEQAGILARVIAPQPLVIEAADSDVRILILNLVANAIHAMPEGGELTVDLFREAGRAGIAISDTGVGIPAEDIANIFLPFWTRRPDGTRGRGLGLGICRQVVEREGGKIVVASELGRGSRFTVYLPDEAEEETAGQDNDV